MNEFSDDVKAMRIIIAEAGYEVTLEDLLDILEAAVQEERDCVECGTSDVGLCYSCLIEKVRKHNG